MDIVRQLKDIEVYENMIEDIKDDIRELILKYFEEVHNLDDIYIDNVWASDNNVLQFYCEDEIPYKTLPFIFFDDPNRYIAERKQIVEENKKVLTELNYRI